MKALAVLIDGSPNDEASLKSAIAITRQLGGRLTVIHPHQPQIITGGGFEAGGLVIDNSAEVAAAAKRAKTAFEHVANTLPGTRLQELDLRAGEVVQKAALYQDLVMLERVTEADGPDLILLGAALWDMRIPVLVLPQGVMAEKLSTVVLGWNRTPAAAHALRAALPLIKAADKLIVLSPQDKGAEDPELKRYLDAEGISAVEWRGYGAAHLTQRAWGRALLAECESLKADLLVTGALGSAIGSWLGLDRATQKICSNAKLPVLLHA